MSKTIKKIENCINKLKTELKLQREMLKLEQTKIKLAVAMEKRSQSLEEKLRQDILFYLQVNKKSYKDLSEALEFYSQKYEYYYFLKPRRFIKYIKDDIKQYPEMIYKKFWNKPMKTIMDYKNAVRRKLKKHKLYNRFVDVQHSTNIDQTSNHQN